MPIPRIASTPNGIKVGKRYATKEGRIFRIVREIVNPTAYRYLGVTDEQPKAFRHFTVMGKELFGVMDLVQEMPE